MPIKILMPALSPTMTEGNLARWLKKEGDKVKAGEVIAEIETDKATMEVEAVDEGILARIVVAEGTENVAVNNLIAILLEEGEDASAIDLVSSNDSAQAAAKPQEVEKVAATSITQPAATTTLNTSASDRVFASPLAKRIAEQENINLTSVQGSGPHGRIVKADVLSAKEKGVGSAKSAPAYSASPIMGRNREEYTLIPNSNMRKVIAKRLCESKQTVPHFYLTIECEVDKLLKVRQEMNDAATESNPYKLSVNDFVIQAVAKSLKAVPEANASWEEAAIKQYNNVDISVAVAIDGGLITPIIKNADMKSISQISNEMKDLAKRARENKLAPHEFQGGSFSISNLGMFGVKQFNAIINPPQSCILAVGASNERVVVKKGEMRIANVMDVTLSVDHRVVDGAVGAKFLAAFKNFIENPMTMFV
ncbi:MAG: branched-chain alpha-keto acid dehydrogenase subunit [Rickettsiaceae bacterium]|jgi:pyruvate dehydrogenase E2 component (dihydrolipoamide acetyltransferase)|nr:branched-chain alpha-keto acid dehydrogenase subunit [Rickettsiaceae bacterium]